jgi:hypothetical protein
MREDSIAYEALGCTTPYFAKYIEENWEEGMSWTSWRKTWNISFFMPVCLLAEDNPEGIKQCFHFGNRYPAFLAATRTNRPRHNWNSQLEEQHELYYKVKGRWEHCLGGPLNDEEHAAFKEGYKPELVFTPIPLKLLMARGVVRLPRE